MHADSLLIEARLPSRSGWKRPLERSGGGIRAPTPVVTTMSEVCGEAALLVKPTDPELIFEAVRRILTETDLAAEYVARGNRREREFTWKDSARATLLAYQTAASAEENEDLKLGGLVPVVCFTTRPSALT